MHGPNMTYRQVLNCAVVPEYWYPGLQVLKLMSGYLFLALVEVLHARTTSDQLLVLGHTQI